MNACHVCWPIMPALSLPPDGAATPWKRCSICWNSPSRIRMFWQSLWSVSLWPISPRPARTANSTIRSPLFTFRTVLAWRESTRLETCGRTACVTSFGVTVNYRYLPDELEENHERFVRGEIQVASDLVSELQIGSQSVARRLAMKPANPSFAPDRPQQIAVAAIDVTRRGPSIQPASAVFATPAPRDLYRRPASLHTQQSAPISGLPWLPEASATATAMNAAIRSQIIMAQNTFDHDPVFANSQAAPGPANAAATPLAVYTMP